MPLAPEKFAQWMAQHEHPDLVYGWVYQYHPRSDAHSVAFASSSSKTCSKLATRFAGKRLPGRLSTASTAVTFFLSRTKGRRSTSPSELALPIPRRNQSLEFTKGASPACCSP